jgi:ribonuclease T1
MLRTGQACCAIVTAGATRFFRSTQAVADFPSARCTISVPGLELLRTLGYHSSLVFKGFPVFRLGPRWWSRSLQATALAACLASGPWLGADQAWARSASSAGVEQTVALAELPSEARHTRRLIEQGGPFPYRKDGTTFFNRERLLPSKPRGYYREYTVRTPGASNRGARRIVCGGQEPTRPSNCYYTSDHYASFRLIIE